MSEQHSSSIKPYLLVLTALAVLTATTVGLSYAKLPHGKAILIACLIAITKCTLIASVFMHLRSERKAIWAILLVALFFVAVLVLAIIPDIGIVK